MRSSTAFAVTVTLIVAQAAAASALLQQDPCELLTNGGFEDPSAGSKYKKVLASAVPGWGTTATDGKIEIWADGHKGVDSHEGDQLVELNARAPDMLYQDFATTPGEELDWSFAHRGHKDDDTVQVKIGAPGESLIVVAEYTSPTGSWIVYSGTYTVPSGQTTTRFGLDAVDSGKYGNLVDSVSVVNDCGGGATTTTVPTSPTTTLAATTTTSTGSTTTTAPGGDPGMQVILLTDTTPPLAAGVGVWIALNWTADGGDAETFRVTATAPGGVEIGYPENTGDHTSLHWNDQLSDTEVDFTALYISLPFDVVGPVDMNVTLTYDSPAAPITQNEVVTIPVLVEVGDGLEQTTTDLGTVPAGQAKWVDVWYTGLATAVGEVSLVVTDDAGFGIIYPQYGPFTSLYYSSSLRQGETDVARFRLDTAGMPPGDYDLTLATSYLVGGEARSIDRVVSITVTDTGSPYTGMLVVSEYSERTDPVPLGEASINGTVFVFFDDTGLDVKKVTFYLDGDKLKTDRSTHFDFKGSSRGDRGKPWDTDTESAGEHTIRAVVYFRDGSTQDVLATFDISP